MRKLPELNPIGALAGRFVRGVVVYRGGGTECKRNNRRSLTAFRDYNSFWPCYIRSVTAFHNNSYGLVGGDCELKLVA